MRLFLRRIVVFVILVAFITIGIWLISDVQVHERYGAILPICIGILTLLFFGLGWFGDALSEYSFAFYPRTISSIHG